MEGVLGVNVQTFNGIMNEDFRDFGEGYTSSLDDLIKMLELEEYVVQAGQEIEFEIQENTKGEAYY